MYNIQFYAYMHRVWTCGRGSICLYKAVASATRKAVKSDSTACRRHSSEPHAVREAFSASRTNSTNPTLRAPLLTLLPPKS